MRVCNETNLIVTCGDDSCVCLWKMNGTHRDTTFTCLAKLNNDNIIMSVDCDVGGHCLALANFDGNVEIWDVEQLQRIHTLKVCLTILYI